MPFANLPDVKIHYEMVGPENAPVLVFSNGLGTTMQMWEPQVAAFSKHFRVLRTDTRGHGQSGVTPGAYSMSQLGLDVVHVLDALKIERAYFCGLSLGGMIGMFLGIHSPERFHKLVFSNTAAKIGTDESWNTRIANIQKGGMKSVSSMVFERWLTAGFRTAHPEFRNDVNKIRLPTLAVAGTHDPTTPQSELHFLETNIPGAKYAEIPAAHLSNVEAPEEFNRNVLQFLLA